MADSSEDMRLRESKEPEAIDEIRTVPNHSAEHRVRHKLDWNVMPLFFVLYMLAFLDRSNIGNAEIAGMAKDLKLTGNRYSLLTMIFYISYVVFEFSLLFWKRFPPHIVAAFVAGAQSWGGMMAIRFLLGAFEAAYAPGIIYLLSFFYLRREVGFRCGLFASAAPLASCFSGALAYGITHGHSKLANWRLLLLVEGLATLIMIPFAYFFIPDSPDKAKFLDENEKAVVRARAVRQTGVVDRVGRLDFKGLLLALVDPIAWLNALMYFGANVSYASLPLYLPTILTELGYSNINAQGLSAPPYFVAFLFAIVTTYIADKTSQRAFMLMATSAVGGAGYVILATVKTVGVRYFATFLASAGVFSTIPNILAWTLNNQGSDTRRGGGLVLINVVGQCGPILGTYALFNDKKDAPQYVMGMSVCAAFMFFTTLLSLALRILVQLKNQRLDREYGANVDEKGEEGAVAVENYGPTFRYVM
ncbi:MAG: hypothetical protein Q9227_009188 [Pyrenula ochraceoflavens]